MVASPPGHSEKLEGRVAEVRQILGTPTQLVRRDFVRKDYFKAGKGTISAAPIDLQHPRVRQKEVLSLYWEE